METFKTLFNPFVPLARLIVILSMTAFYVFLIYELFTNRRFSSEDKVTGLLMGTAAFLLITWMFSKELILTTKKYTFTKDEIREFNFLTLSTKTILKDEVKGFSTSYVPYRIGKFRQVLIYLKDGKKIDLMQFAFFNFSEIQPTLKKMGYTYLGIEQYVWLFPDKREYKYDTKKGRDEYM